MFQMHRSWKGERPAPDPFHITHTDSAGNFHRVQMIDQGHEAVDRYIVKVNGKMVWFGPEVEIATATFTEAAEKARAA